MESIRKIIAFNLCLLFLLVGAIQVQAGLTDNEILTLPVNSGSLDVYASSTASFSAVSFSFSGQTSADNQLGDVNVADTRGTSVGFTVDVTCTDWTSGALTMDYNGDGSATGQLSLDIPEIGEVTFNPNGDDTTGFTMGIDDSFSAATSTINFVTVSNGNGSGDYWFDDFNADQYIPANQAAATYTATTTLTAA